MANPVWFRYALVTIAATAAGGAWMAQRRPRANRDAAPARTARRMRRFGDYLVVGATVTIKATPDRILAAWQGLPELWSSLEFLPFPEGSQPGVLITPPALRDMAARPLGFRIVTDKPDELVAWRSSPPEHADIHGRMRFRDNAAKGTAVEVILALMPREFRKPLEPDAMLSAKVEAGLLRDMRRMKMLIEAGEIATARNQRAAA